jgi:BirA family biotin operon repressor/biotin-[acetyl-CoA-carboxylase] ligase
VSLPPLDAVRLAGLVRDLSFVTRLEVREVVDSTNDVAREMAAMGSPSGSVVVADRQTAGRGRLGRSWHSPPGLGLYLSVLLRPEGDPGVLTRWTLVAGVAACEACRERAGVAATIEWPNDVVWRARKLGGVLAEARSPALGRSDLVVGVGLNVAQGRHDFPQEIADRATSLALARGGGEPPGREELAAAFLARLAELAARLDGRDWASVVRRFEALAPAARGTRVRVSPPGGTPWTGTTAGLADDGALRVRPDDGPMMDVRMVETVRALG